MGEKEEEKGETAEEEEHLSCRMATGVEMG